VRIFLCGAAGAVLLVGCEQTVDEQNVNQTANEPSPPPESTHYVTETECSHTYVYSPPSQGEVFEYGIGGDGGALQPGVVQRQTIGRTSSEQTAFMMTIESDGVGASSPERGAQRLGFLPVESGQRTFRYDGLSSEQLAAMQPGDRLTVEASETSNFGGQTRTIRGDVTVLFKGCGRASDAIPGATGEPVRVYDLTRFYRSVGPGGDDVRRVRVERVVSEAGGWLVLERSASTAMVLTAARPASNAQ
jgi:hypothetical protein